jgi:predicted RNase H-like HicB family nuclease
MNHIIQFNVTKEEEGYSACSADLNRAIYTEGKTFESLIKNIRKSAELYFETECDDDEDIDPTTIPFLLNIELPPLEFDENEDEEEE